MIENAGPVLQTVLGTLFTWGLTALGAGLVFVFQSGKVNITTVTTASLFLFVACKSTSN